MKFIEGDCFVTSHYMKCVVKDGFEKVFEALSREFGTVYARKFGETGESPSGIVLGEHYFFRAENDAAVLITSESLSSGDTRVEIISCAGGKGLLDVSWGAHSAYVSQVKNFLTDSGFDLVIEEGIPYYGSRAS
jgi:hypothetical protein